MKNFLPLVLYVVAFALMPLVFVTIKTVSLEKIHSATFVRTMLKDYLRTFPTIAVVMLPALIFPCVTRLYLMILHFFFSLPLALELGHVHLYGTRIGINTFYSFFVSNRMEMQEFIRQNVSPLHWILFAVFLIAPIGGLALLPVPLWHSPALQMLGCGLTALATIPLIRNLFKGSKGKDGYILNPYANLIVNYFRFRLLYKELKEQIAKHAAPPFEGIVSSLASDERETYVIVIGESANSMHHHYCGYPRGTNEFTDSLGDALMRFQGVRSPFAQTIPSLEKVLTFADHDHPDLVWTKGSVIDYFHDAGFKIYWMSNQYALDDTAITAMTSHADVNKCYNFSGMKRFEKAGLDGGLLPDFRKFVAEEGGKKVLFLHLIGSHSAYVNRYPDEFRHFEGQALGRTLSQSKLEFLNTYDDSIRYTDWLISELIATMKGISGASYVLYFSDHGEDIYDSTDEFILGHSQLANLPMTSVPFMLWVSPRLDELRRDIRLRYPASGLVNYPLEDVIHTILDISSLSNREYDRTKSIFNVTGKDENG